MTPHDWIVAASGPLAWVAAGKLVDRVWAFFGRFRHPCRKGHDMRHMGGRNAGCHPDCDCSVPVYECARCGACDYGENAEARATIAQCETASDVLDCTCQGGYHQPGGIAYRADDCPVHGWESPDE